MQKQQQKSVHLSVSTLLNKKVVTAEGKKLGHVADIQLTPGPEYRIIALLIGPYAMLFRLHVLNPFASSPKLPRRPASVRWEAIDCIKGRTIRLKPGYKHEKSH
jgi:sporulation protein YlmC with PRC-barrel domain